MNHFVCPHRHFPECTSTNDLAREWALDPHDPAPCGAVVTADFQTNGRGRRGREWQAGAGQSALMSFIYRPSAPPSEFGQLGLVAALAAAEALADAAGLEPQIKWPNDLLLEGGKVAGILVESCYTASPVNIGTLGPVVIVGIGINVCQESFPASDRYVYPPTSLRLATGQRQESLSVISAVAHSLLGWEERWRSEGFPPVLAECRKRLALGATVRRGEIRAQLVGLGDDGSAQVCLPDGTFVHWTTVD